LDDLDARAYFIRQPPEIGDRVAAGPRHAHDDADAGKHHGARPIAGSAWILGGLAMRNPQVDVIKQDGIVSVVSAKGDWEVLQVNSLDDEVFATPVPADGELFIRTRSALDNFAK
jgi:hypothetical protein